MDMRKDPLGFLSRLAIDHAGAGLAPLRLGPVDGYLAFAPAIVEQVLRSSMRSFNRQTPVYQTLTRFLGKGILTSEGEQWRKHRRVVQPAFHRKRLRSFASTMIRLADEAIDRWGESIDLCEEMMRLTLSVVGETLFGTDMRWMASELAPALDTAQRHTERVIAGLIPADESSTSRRGRRFERAVETLDRLAYRLIDERRAAGTEGDDVLGMLLAARDEEGKALPRRQVRDEVLTLVELGEGAARVEPGELVLLSPWVTHRLPALWPEPERFDPDRWATPDVPPHPFAFFPFGGGARKCVGEAFAYLEATLVLARIAQRVRLELVGEPPQPEPQLTLGIGSDTRMRVRPR
jgi:cytochrome P450